MHRATVDTYESDADRWEAARAPRALDAARALAARAPTDGMLADLGCGPGRHAAVMRAPVVALDAAGAMVARVPSHAPHSLRVQADLEALPFRRAALAGAWTRNSYVHVPPEALPSALADLHRALAVGAPATLTLLAGPSGGWPCPGDDFPGRFFSRLERPLIEDVLVGAGFTIDDFVEHEPRQRGPWFAISATRARRLADTVGRGMRLLCVGLNPSIYAADAGVGFARPGNRFWPAALAAGIVSRDRDPRHALAAHGIGMTDLVKRATVGAAELSAEEYREGLARIERLAAWLQPGAVCFLGLAGWRAAVDRRATPGRQERRLGGRPVHVMPNPSGLNAHTTVDDLARHLQAAAALARTG